MDSSNIKIIISNTVTLLVVYFCAGIFFNPALVIYIKPFIIPTFIIYVLNNNFNKLTLLSICAFLLSKRA
jgi:hypothetical protein